MSILRTVVDQEQYFRRGHTLTQYIEEPLRLTVDPMQVFKDEDEWLFETLTQEEFLERLESPFASNLWVHLL